MKSFQRIQVSAVDSGSVQDVAKDNPVHIFVTYFNLAYYIGLSPVKLRIVSDNARFESWIPQKVLVGILTTLCIIQVGSHIYARIPSSSSLSPTNFFDFALSVSTFIYKVAVCRIYWFQQERIMSVIRTLVSFPQTSYTDSPRLRLLRRQFRMSGLVSVIFTILTVSNLAAKVSHELDDFWNSMIIQGRGMLFLSQSTKSSVKFGAFSYFLGTIGFLGFYHRINLGLFTDLFVLTNVLALWIHAKSALNGLVQDEDTCLTASTVSHKLFQGVVVSPKMVKDCFTRLTVLCNTINKSCGYCIGFLILESLFYYSTYFTAILENTGGVLRSTSKAVYTIVYLSEITSTFLFCGNICHQMERYAEWISVNVDVSAPDISTILTRIDRKVVSVQAFGVVPMTYITFTNLVGYIMTYFIICLSEAKHSNRKESV